MRAIGIDVHRDFCEVAISEGGRLRSAGRIASTPEALEATPSSKQEQERELALAAECAYQRLASDWQTGRSTQKGAGAAVGGAQEKVHAGPASAAD